MISDALDIRLQQIVADRSERQLLRSLDMRTSPQQVHAIIDGRNYLNFASNDYLSLASHSYVSDAAKRAIDRLGVGSGASPLLSGRSDLHAELEERIAAFLGRPAALCFASGYGANIGVINGLIRRTDAVYCDRLNHASLIDAVRLTGAHSRRYKHADVVDLEQALSPGEEACRWIVTDGVFSMDGDIAPLRALTRLAHTHQCHLLVDDAHGIGVVGPSGKGSLEHAGIDSTDVPVLLGTFGKAFGAAGAFVAGSALLIQALIQVARSYVYSTAPAPALAAAALASLDLIEGESSHRVRLHANIAHFRAAAATAALPLLPSETPIQPILIGDDEQALVVAQGLRERGIYLRAIRPPTVPPGSSRLRICINAAHTPEDIETLIAALCSVLPPRDQV